MSSNKLSLVRFALTGTLCIASAYFTEKSLGALASLPIIIILCAIAYIIYNKPLPLIALCTLGGVVFKAAFSNDTGEIIASAGICALFSALSVTAMYFAVGKKSKGRREYIICGATLLLSFLLYSVFFGTFPGNLTSKGLNEEYLKSEYPDVEFTVKSTYYSIKDGCYLTEAVFRDKEVYTAQFSYSRGGKKIIDGYRDYCEARLLESGTQRLKSFLESYEHEGEDFALRRNFIATEGRLTAGESPDNYYPYMVYDIAFYDIFQSALSFEERCRSFAEYIPDVFEFYSVRFYGIGNSGDFEYQADYSGDRQLSDVSHFDKSQFEKYYSDEDTHKYWSIIK